jgi:hypothetical protein
MEHKKIIIETGKKSFVTDDIFSGPVSEEWCYPIDLVINFLNKCKENGATQLNFHPEAFGREEIILATYLVRDETELERIAREDKDNALDLRHKRAELVALERKVQELKEELENK